MPHDLIVCASLVQNLMNLGGLCRTCEVFGVTELVLPQLSLTESWEFRKLAASGQKWQCIGECPADRLLDWLQAKRDDGYELVALTVQGQPKSLTNYSFKEKTVIVLGRELTGIPADIETICDVAIAIPQYGQVESLNVHTAAAIALYEYRRQHPGR